MENLAPSAQQLCRILSFDPSAQAGLERPGAVDWPAVLALALPQNLAPLLYQRIYALNLVSAVPATVLVALQAQYLRSANRGMWLVRQFDTILAGLNAARIPVIPLKGIYLAQAVYQNPALRPMSDIDILLQSQDMAPGVDVLKALGYQPVRPFDLRSEFKFHRHLPAFIQPGWPALEVHNALQEPSDPFSIDLGGLWSRASETSIGSRAITALEPHDLLLYLCINVAFHDLFHVGLKGLYDLGAVIAHFQATLDWDELYRRCQSWRAARLVYITLSLAHRLLDAAVPAEFLARLAPPQLDEAVFSICTDFIFANPASEAPPVTPDLERLVRAASPLAKLGILLNRLFISRAEMAWYYNLPPYSWKLLLCYPRRLKYLAGRYFSIGLRLGRGDPGLALVSDEIRLQKNQRERLVSNLV
jgi:hypothetical protein